MENISSVTVIAEVVVVCIETFILAVCCIKGRHKNLYYGEKMFGQTIELRTRSHQLPNIMIGVRLRSRSLFCVHLLSLMK